MNTIYTLLLFVTLSMFGVTKSIAESGHDHSKETEKHAHDKGSEHFHGDEESEHEGHDHKKKKKKHESHKGHGEDEDHDHDKESKEHKGQDHGKNSHGHSDHDEKEGRATHDSSESEGHDHSSEGGHKGHGENSFGEGKAIVAVENEGQRFKLSKESVSFLKINSRPIGDETKSAKLKIGQKNLVEYQDKVGIFVRSGEWFELKEGKVVEDSDSGVILLVQGLKPTDHLVTNRLGILRAAHLQASGQGGKGHAH